MPNEIAFVYGSALGIGGLGLQALTALASICKLDNVPTTALGPDGSYPGLHNAFHTTMLPDYPARLFFGRARYKRDKEFGRASAHKVKALGPACLYGFTQVSLEAAEWCADNRIPFVLDNPNSHIRNFQHAYTHESWRWFHVPYLGHPSSAMISRVEREYKLATCIRVSSQYSKNSMVGYGVPADKIRVCPQFIDLERFTPNTEPLSSNGPLRVAFIGSLDLRKGFVYLLRALRRLGPHVELRIVGRTGDPWSRRLFERESRGLHVQLMPGDPRPTLQWAEVLAVPSLEDGFGFVAGEGMASGVPVIISDQCGAAEWIDHSTGWVVDTANGNLVDLWEQHLATALDCRWLLPEMGRLARQSVEQKGSKENAVQLTDWLPATWPGNLPLPELARV